ncbi:hypothetical protein [Amycolatopsis keratiniphila]|uniref:hypothetical protein n=1 Tax=Amycolatopsis keratiniphila TaxID=129921 RepID=UPI0008793231|nr:hypothetical protein [Amycolatopsis keratiniphila]SDU40892.1 hypothetical protein SAMN04489733_3885 [Amycolatopsis keratiniphila]
MTVHARRYGRWCREHFETEHEPEQRPAEAEAAPEVADAEAEQAQAGDAPEARPGSLN